MLTADRLEGVRVRQVRALPGVASWRHRGTVDDGRGGTRAAYPLEPVARPAWVPADLWPDAGAMPARLARPSRVELELAADRWATRPAWIVTLPYGMPPVAGDRLDVTPEAGAPALLVEVLGSYTAGGSWVTCERLAVVEAR